MFISNGYFSPKINEGNLRSLVKSHSADCERRMIELAEAAASAAAAAYALYGDGLGIYEIIGALLEPDTAEYEPPDATLPQLRDGVRGYLAALAANDKAVFSDFFVKELHRLGYPLSETDYLPCGGGEETFVYVKNRLADEAYDVFTQDFSSPRVWYAKDFREAARAVSAGEAEYCLLPLEEKAGARIPSIGAMLFAEDLKINSVTPVFGFDGTADMKYALVSRHFAVPAPTEDDDRYLEIRFSPDCEGALAELIGVAAHLGVSVYRINTSTYETDSAAETYYSVVFSTSGAEFTVFLTYLSIFLPSYTAVGIYSNLE